MDSEFSYNGMQSVDAKHNATWQPLMWLIKCGCCAKM